MPPLVVAAKYPVSFVNPFIRSIAALAVCLSPWLASAQGTAFTYQGRLNDGGKPASGNYDLRFALYDASSGGNQAGIFITNSATAVTNGLFNVVLDFGSQFPGQARWLEIGVRTNGSTVFSTLVPRQTITAVPYAIQADNASSVAATNITGTLPNAVLPASVTYSGTASASGFYGAFNGNGAGLTNLNVSINGQTNVSISSLFTITDTGGDGDVYEQHIDGATGERLMTFEREGSPDSYFWNSKVYQWSDVGILYTDLFNADHYYEAGLNVFRLNGASPYLGADPADNRGYVEVATVFGKNGQDGTILELCPHANIFAQDNAGNFATPLRVDGFNRVMIGDIPQEIHTKYVPANASLEIVGPPSDTPQFHLDDSVAFDGSWTSGDFRSDGTNVWICQRGVAMPVPQMEQTNVTLSAATSFTWQFVWPFADTNYSIAMPTGSAVFSGFYLGAKTTNSAQVFFNSYTGHAEFIVQHQ